LESKDVMNLMCSPYI